MNDVLSFVRALIKNFYSIKESVGALSAEDFRNLDMPILKAIIVGALSGCPYSKDWAFLDNDVEQRVSGRIGNRAFGVYVKVFSQVLFNACEKDPGLNEMIFMNLSHLMVRVERAGAKISRFWRYSLQELDPRQNYGEGTNIIVYLALLLA